MNRKHGHKGFKLKHQPTMEVIYKMTKLDDSNLYKITVDFYGDYTVHNIAKNCYYVVETKHSTCSCPAYDKWGFCKHVRYILQKKNLSYTIVACEHVFANCGNTKKANWKGVRCYFSHERIVKP